MNNPYATKIISLLGLLFALKHYVVQIFWSGVDIFEFWQDMNSNCKWECQVNTEIVV